VMETLVELLAYAERRGYVVIEMQTRKLQAAAFKGGYIFYDGSKFKDERALACAIAHEIGHQETDTFYKWDSPVEVKEKCERLADEWAARHFRGYIPVSRLLAEA